MPVPGFRSLSLSAVYAAEPCCPITSINGNTGIVTAKETATGRIFTFKVADKTLLKSLHVGQAVDANSIVWLCPANRQGFN